MISSLTNKMILVKGELKCVPMSLTERKKLGEKEKKDAIKTLKPIEVVNKKRGNCEACSGYAYFPRLFENNLKCPHCDLKGDTKTINK